MRLAVLCVAQLLILAAPAAAIDGAKERDAPGRGSPDFPEMVLREREKARENYRAMVKERQRTLSQAMARDQGGRPAGGNYRVLTPTLEPEPGPATGTVPDEAGKTRAYLFMFFIVGGILVILRRTSKRLLNWTEGNRPTGEPMTLTLRPRHDRYAGSFSPPAHGRKFTSGWKRRT